MKDTRGYGGSSFLLPAVHPSLIRPGAILALPSWPAVGSGRHPVSGCPRLTFRSTRRTCVRPSHQTSGKLRLIVWSAPICFPSSGTELPSPTAETVASEQDSATWAEIEIVDVRPR